MDRKWEGAVPEGLASGEAEDGAMGPLISVIIAAYNAAETLERAVLSACAQTCKQLEILIIDDASTDATAETARALARQDPRIRYIQLAQNSGPSGARNAGLEAALAPWVCVLDADDSIAPSRLERMLEIAANWDADIVADNMRRVDASQNDLEIGLFLEPKAEPEIIDADKYLERNRFGGNAPSYGYLKPLIRRELLQARKIRYDERLRVAEDFQLCLDVLLAGGRYVLFWEPLYNYTVNQSGSISFRWSQRVLREILWANAKATRRADGSEALRRAFRDRRERIGLALCLQVAVDALKAGRVGRAMREMARKPSIVPRLARAAAHGGGRRLRRAIGLR